MRRWTRTRCLSRTALLALLPLASAGRLGAEDAAAVNKRYPPMPQGSISGTLVRVDAKLNGLIIRDEATSKQMAWKIDPSVVVELSKFNPGDRLWVIYRETGGGNRSITAIGFPGTAQKPLFRNATGSAIQLVSGPFVDGACRGVGEDPSVLRERRMARGASAEDDAPCWCCAGAGDSCAPRNRAYEPGDKVTGTIVLSRCFAGR